MTQATAVASIAPLAAARPPVACAATASLLDRHRRARLPAKSPSSPARRMFTGLVETMGTVVQVTPEGPGCRLTIDAGTAAESATEGDSICVNGCCLTVVGIDGCRLAFEAGQETLSRTNLRRLRPGSQVNLERSLRAGDRLGGHYVSGHVDGLGTLQRREEDPPWAKLWFAVEPGLTRQMACKGSVAVDGVSLTLVDVTGDAFSVALIPHTLSMTTLGRLAAGDAVNIETDILAKYVQRQWEYYAGAQRAT